MFRDCQVLVGLHVGEFLPRAAGPCDFDRDRRRVRPEAEGQREIARRAVGRSAVHDLRLRPDRGPRAPMPSRLLFVPVQPELQPVIAIAAVVAEQVRRAVVGA